jgi:hypothetical protein
MEELPNEVIELTPLKTIDNMMTKKISRTFTQVKLNSLHPEGCSTNEVYGS